MEKPVMEGGGQKSGASLSHAKFHMCCYWKAPEPNAAWPLLKHLFNFAVNEQLALFLVALVHLSEAGLAGAAARRADVMKYQTTAITPIVALAAF